MKILGIETSTRFLSVALVDEEKTLSKFDGKGELTHSKLLIPTIDKVLKKGNTKLKEIDAISLSVGPGSFTGLRIGTATCKGINLSLGIPIIDIPTLLVIAYNFINSEEKILCPLIDAKKNKVYASFYKKTKSNNLNFPELKKASQYMLIDPTNLVKMIKEPTLLFGDAIKLYEDIFKKNPNVRISKKEWLPKAEVVGRLGLEKAKKRKFANPDKLVPMYLHSKYCQVKGYKG